MSHSRIHEGQIVTLKTARNFHSSLEIESNTQLVHQLDPCRAMLSRRFWSTREARVRLTSKGVGIEHGHCGTGLH